jgi:hypothetical protein
MARGIVLGTVPLGGDLRFTSGNDRFVVGTSFYTSNGRRRPTSPLARARRSSASCHGWSDRFKIWRLRPAAERRLDAAGRVLACPHQARRDPASVVQVVENAGAQPEATGALPRRPDATGDREQHRHRGGLSTVETWYLGPVFARVTDRRLEPYAQWDWYRNPEVIADKTYGGDTSGRRRRRCLPQGHAGHRPASGPGRRRQAGRQLALLPVPRQRRPLRGGTVRCLRHLRAVRILRGGEARP